MNGLPEGAVKGDAYGFVGPLKPPSADYSKRGNKWNTDFLMASAYTWGRMDAGETLDVNSNYRFMNAWADMSWEFDNHYRTHMPAMWSAFHDFREAERAAHAARHAAHRAARRG